MSQQKPRVTVSGGINGGATFDSARDTVRALISQVEALEQEVRDLHVAGQDLEDRVALLETRATVRGTGRRSLNDDAIEALRFMERHYPMKFTAFSLAENLSTGSDHRRLGGQLRSLLARGLAEMHTQPNRTALWSAVAPEKRPGHE